MDQSEQVFRTEIAPGTGAMRAWLVILGLMVYAMILIGGATRLTDSGLSITEWAPLHGALPPLSEAAWQVEFDKYRQTAEYQIQNRGMSLSEFQYIYWWEWGHRQFGRIIGLVAVAGFALFALRGWLTARWAGRFALLIVLGGLQGAIGWWMVSSGIGETTRVDVAPYRLATHFGLALLIIGLISWFWLDLGTPPQFRAQMAGRSLAFVLLALVFIQMVSGALVAGLDAGRSYTDWPRMAGEWVPRYYVDPDLGLRSLFEGREATQFNHRTLAYLLWIGALAFAVWQRRSALRQPAFLLAGLVTVQAGWGILTLLNAAPMGLALIHQGLGVVVFLAAVFLAWRAAGYSPTPESDRRVSAPASTKTT